MRQLFLYTVHVCDLLVQIHQGALWSLLYFYRTISSHGNYVYSSDIDLRVEGRQSIN